MIRCEICDARPAAYRMFSEIAYEPVDVALCAPCLWDEARDAVRYERPCEVEILDETGECPVCAGSGREAGRACGFCGGREFAPTDFELERFANPTDETVPF